jgi:LacI family transcriptional regulator
MSRPMRPDAIFCANDLMAVGCYEALKELGERVGETIAVMGYDDQEIAQHLSPALSTVLSRIASTISGASSVNRRTRLR